MSPSSSVADYWDAHTLSWRIHTCRSLKDDELKEYVSLLSLLNSYSPIRRPDSTVWSLDSSGSFIVDSIRKSPSDVSMPPDLF